MRENSKSFLKSEFQIYRTGRRNGLHFENKCRKYRNAEQYTQFDIIESEKTKGEIFVSPDIAPCDECKEEMFDKKKESQISASFYQLYLLRAAPYHSGVIAI